MALGLAIGWKLVARYGGISLKSRPECGSASSFTV